MSEELAQAHGIANKLYSAREAIINIEGAEVFRAKVNALKPMFEGLRKKRKLNHMEVTLEMIKEAKENDKEGAVLLIMAASIEIMEPSL